MLSAILKSGVLYASLLAHFQSTTPPQPPADASSDKIYKGQVFERMGILPLLRTLTKILFTLAVVSETTVILAAAFGVQSSSPLIDTLCPRRERDLFAMQSISLTFAAGAVLNLLGGYIRHWTYKVLGELFTYEVAVRPQHQLVMRAPYNIVRHPSYTGLFMHFGGVAVMHFAEGGWNRECGIMHTPAVAGVLVWVVLSVFAMSSVWRRGAVEDKLMQSKFGEKWLHYYQQVPYKYFPYVV